MPKRRALRGGAKRLIAPTPIRSRANAVVERRCRPLGGETAMLFDFGSDVNQSVFAAVQSESVPNE